jgi:hypothetical protein
MPGAMPCDVRAMRAQSNFVERLMPEINGLSLGVMTQIPNDQGHVSTDLQITAVSEVFVVLTRQLAGFWTFLCH